MARGWKRSAEVLLARSGIASGAEKRAGPSSIILGYHNIVPRGEGAVGDASLHVDQDVFARQLDFILEGREIVGLREALEPSPDGSRRTRVAITFDDAYQGTMSAGVEELEKRGLPATVFVPPGLLGASGFWWDRLSSRSDGLDPAIRDHALSDLQGRDERILAWAEAEGLPLQTMPEHARPVDSAGLDPGPGGSGPGPTGEEPPGGITFGAHTWSHPNLAALSDAEIEDELVKSKAFFSSAKLPWVEWLAYPYGLMNDRVATAAESHFEGAVLIAGGAARSHGSLRAPAHVTPRVNVPRGLTIEGLALRLASLLP